MRQVFAGSLLIGVVALASANSLFAQTKATDETQSVNTANGGAVTMPATTRSQVKEQAASQSGRTDPLAPVTGFKHFPSHDASYVPVDKTIKTSKTVVEKNESPKGRLSDTNPYLKIPPPPPNTAAYAGSPNELPISELPAPPERPTLLNSIKLTGIVGDRAIFSITDLDARVKNNWPKALSLAAGDHFEGVSVISVDAHGVVLEENGERIDKHLERIR